MLSITVNILDKTVVNHWTKFMIYIYSWRRWILLGDVSWLILLAVFKHLKLLIINYSVFLSDPNSDSMAW